MKTQDIKNVALALKAMREGAMKPEVKKALAKSAAASEKGKKAVTLPKAPFKMEAMDAVDKSELKGKHKDRKDKDIDNDGDVDSSDKFLHKRRKAVGKAMASKKTPSVEKDADIEVQEDMNKVVSIIQDRHKVHTVDINHFGDHDANAKKHNITLKKTGDYSHDATGKKKDLQRYLAKHYDSHADAKKRHPEVHEAALDEAPRRKGAPKMTGDSVAIQRAKDAAHNAAMGRTKTGRKKPERTMTSTRRSLASLRGESVQEAATATHKPNNGSDAEQGLSPNAKKMMAMKTDAPEGTDITKVAPKTFAAMRASGKKAAMRNNDNAKGESKIKPSATEAK